MSRYKLIAALLIVAISTAGVFAASFGSWLSVFENRSWDVRVSLIAPLTPADPKIKLITIDQRSLDHYAREEGITWPWPRSLYIPVIKFLESAGAKLIVFDILFTESAVHGVADDREFAKAVAESKVPVVSAMVLSASESEVTDDGFAGFTQRISHNDDQHTIKDRYLNFIKQPTAQFRSATLPFTELIEASPFIGATNGFADSDGVFRHIFPGGFLNGNSVLSLPFEAHRAIAGKNPDPIVLSGNEAVRLRGPSGSYTGDNIVNIISSFVSLQDDSPKPVASLSEYKDAIVFVGVDAPGLLDLRPTSLDRSARGVELNATILDNLLHNDFIRHSSILFDLLLTIVLSAGVTFGVLFSSRLRNQIEIFIAVMGVFLATQYEAAVLGVWIACVAPFFTLLFAGGASLAVQYQLEGRNHRFIRGAFTKYVSPQVIEQIVLNPSKLALGGERRELTMFFSDIKGFTGYSEKMDPEKVVRFLNTYLSELTDIILTSGGTVDKYEGDAIIAFWNAPLQVDNHAELAVRAALRCQERLHELDSMFRGEYGFTPTTRIGLNTGVVTVGNFGSKGRFDYTMIGDAANLASRLEGVNKVFGTTLLISEATLNACAVKPRVRPLGSIQVVGRAEGVKVFEPLMKYTSPTEEVLTQYQSAFERAESGREDEALKIFKGLTEDPVSKNYVEKLERDPGSGVKWKAESK